MGSLPTQQAVNAAKAVVPYDSAPWNANSSTNGSFRNRLEGVIHNPGHMWVGGSMMAMSSPNDPVFWLHHCNIDRLWAEWQREHPDQQYLPPSGTPGVVTGHGLDDPMPPWNNETTPPTPRSVLDHHALGYTYDNEPVPPQVVSLTVDAPPVTASIGQAGEVDVFSFVVSSSGRYTIATEGTTDVVMGLYGPDDMTTLLVEDDDSGAGSNAQIARDLAPGTYYARVRHYSGSSTGEYRISVTQAAEPSTPPTIQIQINGPAVQGDIGTANERDLYRFTVTAPGAYTIETAGNTDCVLRLLGPETPTMLIAEDDDSGPDANSRIVASLQPGTYFAEVRHYSPTGTGSYSISVRS
jgi:tyrosinase